VNREVFDDFLLKRARAAGADFQLISDVSRVRTNATSVILSFGQDREICARYLIAADGANSRMRRLAAPRLDFSRGFAVEGIITDGHLNHKPGMELNFGEVDDGYGWLFPKNDHTNIGIYTSGSNTKLSKAALLEFARKRLGCDQVERVCGYPLGFGGQTYRHTSERVLFAGDAAGMCEPLLGEGLHNALKSGRLAADAVSKAVLSTRLIGQNYNRSLRDIKKDLKRCKFAARVFYPTLRMVGFRGLTMPTTTRLLLRGFAGGKTLYQISNPKIRGFNPDPNFPSSLY
jgi:flavin-dependent dehydrogenase